MTLDDIREQHPESLTADGFDEAVVGVDYNGRIIYDARKMVDVLVSDDWDPDEALEYLEFNTFCAYVGEYTPIYMFSSEETTACTHPIPTTIVGSP